VVLFVLEMIYMSAMQERLVYVHNSYKAKENALHILLK